MKALSLFSGIGGLDLAAQSCGFEPVAFCEIEPFPVSILKKRFPCTPVLPDVKEVNGADYRGTVDIVFGGFPCQDLSVAGQKRGLIDANGNVTRSGLWFEMLRIISECRPRFVVAENVRGAVNAALDTCKSGLESENYEVRPIVFPASAIGAPHQRERLFILAVRRDVCEQLEHAASRRLQGGWDIRKFSESALLAEKTSNLWRTPDANANRGAMSEALYQRRITKGEPININAQVAHEERSWPTASVCGLYNRKGTSPHSGDGLATSVKSVMGNKLQGQLNPDWVEQLMGYPAGWTNPNCETPQPWQGWPARPGEAQFAYEFPRTTRNMPNRAKRLKALGNSVVPQQALPVFEAVRIMNGLIEEEL